MSVRYGDETPQNKELKWDGNICRLTFIFDPEEWATKEEAEVEGIPMQARPNLMWRTRVRVRARVLTLAVWFACP